jgi:hypothetical protein
MGTRHRYRGFATTTPASDTFSPLSLSRWRARPEAAPRVIHPWPPRAARRLSTSATVTTQEHNCAIVQTPPTAPVVAHVRSFLHSMHLGTSNGARVAVLRGTANRDFTGQGPRRLTPARAPSATIARGGGLTPTRSTRTPHVARPWQCRSESPAPPGRPERSALLTNPPTSPARAGPAHRVASRVLPRRRPRSAAPEVPSTAGPPGERLVPSPQTVPSLWIGRPGAFSISRNGNP